MGGGIRRVPRTTSEEPNWARVKVRLRPSTRLDASGPIGWRDSRNNMNCNSVVPKDYLRLSWELVSLHTIRRLNHDRFINKEWQWFQANNVLVLFVLHVPMQDFCFRVDSNEMCIFNCYIHCHSDHKQRVGPQIFSPCSCLEVSGIGPPLSLEIGSAGSAICGTVGTKCRLYVASPTINSSTYSHRIIKNMFLDYNIVNNYDWACQK